MGLLYAFPVSLEENDFAKVEDKTLTLKTYGLPYIFWGYGFAVITVILFMFFAIKSPVYKLIELGDETDAILGYSLLTFVSLLPMMIIGVFFYEKRIICSTNKIFLEYRIFGIRIFREEFTPKNEKSLSIAHFLSSPNLARMRNDEDHAHFQNKGYFVLWLETINGKKISLDRHSRKADLTKLCELIEAHIKIDS